MDYRREGNTLIIRLDRGDNVIEKIQEIAVKEQIATGFISAIGATDNMEIGCYEFSTKEFNTYTYEGDFEITSLLGNVTKKDGKPYVHLHINATDHSGKMYGGHLVEARISVTCEMMIQVLETEVGRKLDEVTNINIFEF